MYKQIKNFSLGILGVLIITAPLAAAEQLAPSTMASPFINVNMTSTVPTTQAINQTVPIFLSKPCWFLSPTVITAITILGLVGGSSYFLYKMFSAPLKKLPSTKKKNKNKKHLEIKQEALTQESIKKQKGTLSENLIKISTEKQLEAYLFIFNAITSQAPQTASPTLRNKIETLLNLLTLSDKDLQSHWFKPAEMPLFTADEEYDAAKQLLCTTTLKLERILQEYARDIENQMLKEDFKNRPDNDIIGVDEDIKKSMTNQQFTYDTRDNPSKGPKASPLLFAPFCKKTVNEKIDIKDYWDLKMVTDVIYTIYQIMDTIFSSFTLITTEQYVTLFEKHFTCGMKTTFIPYNHAYNLNNKQESAYQACKYAFDCLDSIREKYTKQDLESWKNNGH